MHRSTCSSTSSLVFMVSVLSLESPTVTDQMAHYVAPVAFGRTWTIMMISLHYGHERLGPAVIFLLPVPCSVNAMCQYFASVRKLLLGSDCFLGSVIQLPLAFSAWQSEMC
ncbi:hypothetical protein Tco_1363233 [Tanacetum coccineum]